MNTIQQKKQAAVLESQIKLITTDTDIKYKQITFKKQK